MISVTSMLSLAREEIVQLREEGAEVAPLEVLLQRADHAETCCRAEVAEAFWAQAEALRVALHDSPSEPSDLAGIHAARADGPRRLSVVHDEALADRLLGAWLGRCAGCMLGKPVEGRTREQIEAILQAAGWSALDNYFPPLDSVPEGLHYPRPDDPCLLGNITHGVRDDDTDYTVLGFHLLEAHGPDFTTRHVAEAWLNRLPYHQTYTAERVAYRNLVDEVPVPETAVVMNPYREWIGAQIRADGFGYGAPGWPEKAAEFAFRDAALSHTKNGIYGEMYFAALIAACLATEDLDEAIQLALTEVPAESRFADMVRQVVAWCAEDADWDATWGRTMGAYGGYHPVHTINNAALVLAGLLHSGGDFGKAICLSVWGGLDTDCNGATAGSVMGALLGGEALPKLWTEPLQDTLHSAVQGFHVSRISHLAQRTLEVAEKVLAG
jgi:ADP-ribosylglycohydrolase